MQSDIFLQAKKPEPRYLVLAFDLSFGQRPPLAFTASLNDLARIGAVDLRPAMSGSFDVDGNHYRVAAEGNLPTGRTS